MPRTVAVTRACLSCRARHLKCSEERPSCCACVRAELLCQYPHDNDLVFRDQIRTTKENVEKTEQLRARKRRTPQPFGPKASESGASTQTTWMSLLEALPFDLRSGELKDLADSPVALSNDIEHEALTVFFTRYCSQNRDVKGEQGLNNVLPILYNGSSSVSAFSLAVTAFALAVVGRWPERMDFKRRSIERYQQAVTAMNNALSHPQQLVEDEMLAAVMQLIAYEKMNLPHVAESGVVHMNGLLTLLKLRGVQNCNTQISHQLLSVARTHALIMHCSPVEDLAGQDEHIWVEAPGDVPSNLSTELVKTAAEIRWLRRMAKAASPATTDTTVHTQSSIQEIVATALKIDSALLAWQSRVPMGWVPFVADTIPLSVRLSGMYKGLCTVYCNIWAANSWNKYRLARIAIHTIILEQLGRLPSEQRDQRLIDKCQTALQGEINGICSTVPFYLGSRDTTKTLDQPLIEFPSSSSVSLTEETRDQLITMGEWFLFWPLSRMLHNLDALDDIPDFAVDKYQMEWVQTQIVRNGWRAATRSSLGSNAP